VRKIRGSAFLRKYNNNDLVLLSPITLETWILRLKYTPKIGLLIVLKKQRTHSRRKLGIAM